MDSRSTPEEHQGFNIQDFAARFPYFAMDQGPLPGVDLLPRQHSRPLSKDSDFAPGTASGDRRHTPSRCGGMGV